MCIHYHISEPSPTLPSIGRGTVHMRAFILCILRKCISEKFTARQIYRIYFGLGQLLHLGCCITNPGHKKKKQRL